MKNIKKIMLMGFFILPMFVSCGETSSEATSEVEVETTSDDTPSVLSEEDVVLEDIKPETFTIYSLNDTHGALEEDASGSTYQAGVANLDWAIKNDVDYNDYRVLLSAGDMSQGTGISNISKGQAMMESMNAMNFDAMTIGNHEFDWGTDVIEEMEETAEFPFLGINILNKDDGEIVDFSQASTIVEKGQLKVGIVGSIYANIRSDIFEEMIQDIDFVDDSELVMDEAERLKTEEDCDVVVVLSHQGGDTSSVNSWMNDDNISGIFGGHDHLFTNDSNSDKSCYFLEAGSSGKGYAKLSFQLNEEDGEYSITSGSYTQLDEYDCYYATSPVVESIVAKWDYLAGKELDEILGYRDRSFTKSMLGRMVCDSMMYYAEYEAGVDDIMVAVHNYGGIRSTWDSDTQNDQGTYDITYNDVYEVMPFDNKVQMISLTGTELISACSSSYHSSNYIKDGTDYYCGDILIDREEDYNVLAVDYMISNEDDVCYKGVYAGTNLNDVTELTRDCIRSYIEVNGTVYGADYI
jgi:2',3'-cyclic-nucleotide 2'-phosphodiesterase/3'-nucleotidase